MYQVFLSLCQRNGVKPFQVAKATGIGASTFTDWKKGRITQPNMKTLQLIADYFGVSVDYLITGDQETEEGYYTDPETAKLAQEILDDPNLRALFSAARDLKPDELQAVATMLRKFKETNPDG